MHIIENKEGMVGSIKSPIKPHRSAWNRKYTDEEAEKVAKKYKTKADFRKNDKGYYYYALRRHIMPKFTWLQSEPHLFNAINYVYRYYFQEQNAVYVGRTINIEERDFDHHRDRGKESSAVLKFAKERGVEVPKIEILERGLTGEESQIKEDDYVRKYRNEGFIVLNKGATGKGTGSLGIKKKYSRKRFLEIASRYEFVSDFSKEQHPLYVAAVKYGWLQDAYFLKRKNRTSKDFSKEMCLSVARQCSSRTELFDRDSTVYSKMLKEGWMDECEWLKSAHEGQKTLTHVYCLEIAKRYSSLTIMHKEQSAIVKKLYKTGWIDECKWLPSRKVKAVSKYSLQGEFVGRFNSLSEAASTVVSARENVCQNIKRVCMGKKQSAYGFIWRYADAEDMLQQR